MFHIRNIVNFIHNTTILVNPTFRYQKVFGGGTQSLKKWRKPHQKLLYLLLRHRRMYRLQLDHPFLRIVIGRIALIGDMQLMPLGIRMHIVLPAKVIDDKRSLFLILHRDRFYRFRHSTFDNAIPILPPAGRSFPGHDPPRSSAALPRHPSTGISSIPPV